MDQFLGGRSYADLYYHFRRFLRETNIVIICGYSFRDKAINTQILEWAYLSDDYRIIVIHPKPDDVRQSSRPAIGNHWDSWLKAKKLRVIPKGIEDTSWNDLRKMLQ